MSLLMVFVQVHDQMNQYYRGDNDLHDDLYHCLMMVRLLVVLGMVSALLCSERYCYFHYDVSIQMVPSLLDLHLLRSS